MIRKTIFCLLLLVAASFSINAQNKKVPDKKSVVPKAPTKCSILLGETANNKLTVTQLLAWCDSVPLVKGDNNVKYKLKSFDINVIQKEPFLSQDYGTGEGGMPILARKAIENLKEGDSVFLKNIIYVNAENQDQKLPNLVVSIVGK